MRVTATPQVGATSARPKRKQETSVGAAKKPGEVDKHETSYSGYVSRGIKNTVLLQTVKVKSANPDYPANIITARLISIRIPREVTCDKMYSKC